MKVARNNTLDFVKGLLTIGIILIHVGSWLVVPSGLFKLLRAELSLCVPLFFMISGYFFYKTQNPGKSINRLIRYLLIYGIVCILWVNINGLPTSSQTLVHALFSISNVDVGYLWFIQYLIIFQAIFTVLNHRQDKSLRLKLLILLLFEVLLVYTSRYRIYIGLASQIIFFGIGYFISKIENKWPLKCKPFIVLLFIVPIATNGYYIIISAFMILVTVPIFMGINSFDMKVNRLSFFSRNSLNFLFVQYFYFSTLEMFSVKSEHQYIISIISLAVVSLLVWGYEKTLFPIVSRMINYKL